jgi:ubiquinol-cytochrome c reductase cytochrome c1 subunit
MKKLLITAGAVAGLMFGASAALAAAGEQHIEDHAFAHEGPFGKYDQAQLQRGFQVFYEVCSSCHGLKYVSFRELGNHDGPGFPEEQIKAFAENFEVYDPDLEPGETRAARPSDKFPVNSGAGAPDLSMMAKARAGFHGPNGLGINQLMKGIGGPEYIYNLLLGYDGHDKEEAGATLYANTAFPGGYLSMAPPLSEGVVEYAEGQPEATMEQMSEDIASFLMWTAEPDLTARKGDGFMYIGFTLLLVVLFYLTNKSLWASVKRKDGDAA